jgi:hypothetical protein
VRTHDLDRMRTAPTAFAVDDNMSGGI